MIRRLTLGAVSLLLLACVPTIALCAKAASVRASASPALSVDTAPVLFDSVAAHYAQLSRFHFAGQTHVEISGAAMPQTNILDIPFVFAAIRPSKLRTEMQNPAMPSTLVSDGDTLWVLAQSLHQYTAQAAPSIVPGSASSDPMTRSLDPLQSYALMREGVVSVTSAGSDTVMTAAGPVSCRKLVATYTPDSSAGAPEILPRVLWVDESRLLVMRDSLSMHLTHPQMGALTSFQDTRFVVLDDKTGGPESLYRFVPPAGSQKVARIGAPGRGAPGPDMSVNVGKPAADFTLAALAGKPVTLSKLKGKVVVLDFWATWCGPCRRWMPIVEKVTHEKAAKGVVVYAVNLRETPAQVRTYLTSAGVKVPVLLDKDGAVGAAYGASSIPLTVVIGRDGKIVRTMVGLHAEEDMRAALREAGIQ